MSNSEMPLGRVAFEEYRRVRNAQTFDGRPIPAWEELHGDRASIQGAWEAAAAAAVEEWRSRSEDSNS